MKQAEVADDGDGTRIDHRRGEGASRSRPGAGDNDATRVQTNLPSKDTHDDTTWLAPKNPAPEHAESDSGAVPEGPADGRLGVGSLLRQRFRIDSVLGEGGMGTVFGAVDLLKQEARDEQVHVALKVMKQDLVDAELSFMGLQREARRAQQLAHPNIVTVYDFDRADGHIYMTMEHLTGQPVSALLKSNPDGLSRAEAHDITLQIAEGLAYAHGEGIVHVDLKPQNVFLLDNGRAKILDFGIAKAYQSRKSDRVEDVFSGFSPLFASPELMAGERPQPQDDVFALGLVAYALFTGRHAFDWKSAEEARAADMRPTRDPVFRRYEWKAVQSALAFDREARPADAAEFIKRFSPSLVKRTAVAVSLGSVLAALAFVLLYQPEAGPATPFEELPAELQTQIRSSLADAEEFASFGDLNSALQLYDEVLVRHPGNRIATEGMAEIAEQALARIRASRASGAIDVSAARASLQSLLAYETLPHQARQEVEQAVDAL
ncbi:MAG: serine/threonine-protein kinase [Wenzhouxiangellaceae bacterium]